jgi:hypothetical protein
LNNVFLAGFKVVVLSDCVGALSKAELEGALDVGFSQCATVKSMRGVVESIRGAKHARK